MSDKYAFIDAEYADTPAANRRAGLAPTITLMCAWLRVSKSGFYEWRSRPQSPTTARRELLKVKIKALFDANDGTYGYRRLHAALIRGGEHVSPELVRRLMRQLDLVACQPRPWRKTTITGDEPAIAPDLVARDFTATEPGTKLVGDITYVRTWARMAVPGHRDRLLQQRGRRLRHGRPHAHRPGHRRPRHGRTQPHLGRGMHLSLRPRHPASPRRRGR